MHRSEHRNRKHRAPRPSAPRQPISSATGSTLSGTPQSSLPLGTGRSRRPFTRLQRIPLSRSPFQGQSSWPCASLPCQTLPRPVRLFAPLPFLPVCAGPGSFIAEARCRFHVQPCSPRACPALNTATGRAERLASSLPESRFRSASGSMRPGTPQTLSRPGPDARVGLSLACNESAFTVSIPGSTFLACRFASYADRFHDPFGPLLRHRPSGCARDRQHQRSLPVAASAASLACRCPGLHSPSGLLHPYGSKRSAGLLQAGPPSEPARFPFAPRSSVLLLVCRFGSTFPSRYVSGGLQVGGQAVLGRQL